MEHDAVMTLDGKILACRDIKNGETIRVDMTAALLLGGGNSFIPTFELPPDAAILAPVKREIIPHPGDSRYFALKHTINYIDKDSIVVAVKEETRKETHKKDRRSLRRDERRCCP